MKLNQYETFFIVVVCITVHFLSYCETTTGSAGTDDPVTELVTDIDPLETTAAATTAAATITAATTAAATTAAATTAAATTSTTTKLQQPTAGTTVADDSSTVGTASQDGTPTQDTSPGGTSTGTSTEGTTVISMTTEGTGATSVTREGTNGTTNIETTRGTISDGTTTPMGSNPVTDETDASTTRVDDITSVPSTKSPETTSTVTTATEQQTTQPPLRTTEAVSSPRVTTRLSEPQSPPPNYPEATFPDVEAPTALVARQIAVEVAVNNADCEANNLEGQPCDKLKEEFESFADLQYGNVSGYVGITNIELRKGSVIIAHQVFYDYNKMTPDDKQLSAEGIYEQTLAPSVNSKEQFGDSTFTECTDCTATQELNNLCNEDIYSVTCDVELEAQCSGNTWRCVSPCENMYCNEESAICRQAASDKIPTCSCLQSDEGWYIGAQCQFYVDRLWLIVGFSVGGGVVLIIILILIICLCKTRKELKESRKMPFEKTTEAFLLGNDLQIDNVEDSHEMDDFVNGRYITDDDEASPKPYSYVYAADVDPNYGRKGSKDIRPQEYNPELERALQERAYTDKTKPSQSFWGNLEHEVISEIPNTTGQNHMPAKNVNQSKAYGGKQQANGYPQKRPQSAGIPPPDYGVAATDPFSKRYSQIVSDDYGKSKKKH